MISRTERVAGKTMVGAFLIALACGDDSSGRQPIVRADFEDRCGDVPCEWEQTSGDSSQARYIETIHPGEHGMALSGDGVSIRGPGGDVTTTTFTFGSLEARLVARCDAGDSLSIVLGVIDETAAGGPRPDMLQGRAVPPAAWGTGTSATLTLASPLGDGGFGGGTGATLRITGLVITKNGPGQCEIAEITIDQFGLFTDFSTRGC